MVQDDDPQPSVQSTSQLYDDNFIFKHFYQNKILLIKQHKKEEREEKEAYAEAMLSIPAGSGNVSGLTAPLMGHRDRERKEDGNDDEEPHSGCPVKLLKKYFFRQSMPFCHYSGHNLWILKATRLNQGQGIHVANSLQ